MYKCAENINYLGSNRSVKAPNPTELIRKHSEIKLTEVQMLLQNLLMLTCLPQAGIKAFGSHFRGVRNVEFFLFRPTNIYA